MKNFTLPAAALLFCCCAAPPARPPKTEAAASLRIPGAKFVPQANLSQLRRDGIVPRRQGMRDSLPLAHYGQLVRRDLRKGLPPSVGSPDLRIRRQRAIPKC